MVGCWRADRTQILQAPAAIVSEAAMFCPNCMSPYVERLEPDEDGEPASPDEPIMRCTECEYAAPVSEFVPENYR